MTKRNIDILKRISECRDIVEISYGMILRFLANTEILLVVGDKVRATERLNKLQSLFDAFYRDHFKSVQEIIKNNLSF